MTIESILYGFIWGFLLCFTFGPAFFAIVQTSIDVGYKKGILIIFGVIAADIILMFFAIFGTNLLPNINHFQEIISIAGALLLLGMGLYSLFGKKKQLVYPESLIGNLLYYFSKGVFLNFLNPANFLMVVSTCAYVRGVLKFSINETICFFTASLFATLLAETILAFYASKIKKATNEKIINKINKIAGFAFILIALKLLWKQFL